MKELKIKCKARLEEKHIISSNPNFFGKAIPKNYEARLMNIGGEVEPDDYWFELNLKRFDKPLPIKFDKDDGDIEIELIIRQSSPSKK